METKQKHTQVLLEVDNDERHGGWAINDNTTSPRSFCIIRNKTEAEHLVRCWNSHYRLLELCKDALDSWEDKKGYYPGHNNLKKALKQVIKKAGG